MGLGGLEPPTSRLSGVRSNQLSYGPTGRASMGGLAEGQVTHSRTQSCRRPFASETQEAAAGLPHPEGGQGRLRGFSSKLQKER